MEEAHELGDEPIVSLYGRNLLLLLLIWVGGKYEYGNDRKLEKAKR
jgi:hypothetical protein